MRNESLQYNYSHQKSQPIRDKVRIQIHSGSVLIGTLLGASLVFIALAVAKKSSLSAQTNRASAEATEQTLQVLDKLVV